MKNIFTMHTAKYMLDMAEELSNGSASHAVDVLCRYLTPSEFQSLALRWEIIRRLDNGETYREIALKLHVSPATVSRWAAEEWRWRNEA